MAGEATLLTVPAGDWLQAGAGFLGVIVTILATLWIERYSRSRGARRKLRNVLSRMIYLHAIVQTKIPPTWSANSDRQKLIEVMTMMINTLGQFHFLRDRAEIADPDHWLALQLAANGFRNIETDLMTRHKQLIEAGENAPLYAAVYSATAEEFTHVKDHAGQAMIALD